MTSLVSFSVVMHYSLDIKKNTGCQNAIFTMQQTVNYFTQRGSTVFVSSLDASKAFDRISHVKLFRKLIKRHVPSCLIGVLCNWYSKLHSCVRWNGTLSAYFIVRCGVRQGGVLSPFLFNIYVDDLIAELEASDIGCHVANQYFGCIMYADDLIVLSASVSGLQRMLDICYQFGLQNSLIFNQKKSVCFKVGGNHEPPLEQIRLGNNRLQWVTTTKYLGLVFNASRTLQVEAVMFVESFILHVMVS